MGQDANCQQQAGTASDPIAAIPAAIATGTTLLLGLWGSAGQDVFNNELSALKAAISQYGSDMAKVTVGISIGSEDLYRNSAIAKQNGETNPGASPDTIASYIKQVRDAIANTPLSGTPIGHVDTWTAWVDGANKAVIDSCDWIGVDAYPYFQSGMANSIGNSMKLFTDAVSATQAAVGSQAALDHRDRLPRQRARPATWPCPPSTDAKTYWDQVGCSLLFGKTNVWWFTLWDADPATPNPSFGIVGNTLSTTRSTICRATTSPRHLPPRRPPPRRPPPRRPSSPAAPPPPSPPVAPVQRRGASLLAPHLAPVRWGGQFQRQPPRLLLQ